MQRANRYEMMYIKATSFFSVVGLIYFIVNNLYLYNAGSNMFSHDLAGIAFLVAIIGLNGCKYLIIKKQIFKSKLLYIFVRLLEVLVLVLVQVLFHVDIWVFGISLLLIAVTSLSYGLRSGLYILFSYSILHYLMNFYMKCHISHMPFKDFMLSTETGIHFFIYYFMGISAMLCSMIYRDNSYAEKQNEELMKELEEKYGLLEKTQQEIQLHYEKVKQINASLEDTNKKLSVSLGEFYTLQQVSQAISSIFSIKDLLKFVNDVIIGVMGVNYSTIILYDDKENRLKVHTTNIKDMDELLILDKNINSCILMDLLEKGELIFENIVSENIYSFTRCRNINSLICVPLMSKTKRFGLVLVEHKLNNAFNEENVRLLDIMAQQVSIAMENAQLYQEMQKLASIDGLTGVYNRLYFQSLLTKEFKNAFSKGYNLAVTIFDVDYFKVFNDTYGHIFGDKVIKCIVEIVKSSLSKTDIIARYGGEEFIILFPRTSLNEAYLKVEELRQKIAGTVIKDEIASASVTASFGVSCYPNSGTNEVELLRKADEALYEAKSNGRNCVRVAG